MTVIIKIVLNRGPQTQKTPEIPGDHSLLKHFRRTFYIIHSVLFLHLVTHHRVTSYFNSLSIDFPIVPFGIVTPKLSAIVAPITAKVSSEGILPPPLMDGEYARNGTFSFVWSVPVYVGSFPWSAVKISKSFSLTYSERFPASSSNRSISFP